MNFYISDHHFGHQNIIKYCNRPFKNVNEMNEYMIKMWNSVVNPLDTVIHGGDFSLTFVIHTATILKRLNGHKILVLGNHDHSPKCMKNIGFNEVHSKYYFEEQDQILVMHYQETLQTVPWEIRNKAVLWLHGHNHSPGMSVLGKWVNIGVEAQNYVPKTKGQLLKMMQRYH